MSGSSGLIGRALTMSLASNGHIVSRLLRPQSKSDSAAVLPGDMAGPDVLWNPVGGQFDAEAAEGHDAVVHLAGASIAGGRWTPARKALLRSSRVEATRDLVDSFARLDAKPKIFVAASAVGYFGDRGEEKLTEHSGPGNDFLAQLARDWEREAQRAAEFGARVVQTRFGVVLSTQGGALPRMILPVKLFVGGKMGSGKQWMSWISLRDVVGVLRLALANESIRGPINAVAPEPVRNAEFVTTLASVLHRPAIFPAPALGLHTLLGEMADALLLSSQRVIPDKLETLQFVHQDADLREALRRIVAERA
jgi:uncharacterized protein